MQQASLIGNPKYKRLPLTKVVPQIINQSELSLAYLIQDHATSYNLPMTSNLIVIISWVPI